ncbi:MAG: NAD(P)/FAD-dependent oxidoreductase [Bacteroidetes bacterium]|nr:MAG: NAD(P)/FAD-dependent oxidoreductase [Bacteroidota bacterium]
MTETAILIVGSSISGLAVAASLKKQGLHPTVIEKEDNIASPWRHHYNRLHLHTNKRISSLPFKKFDKSIPRYPSRQQVVDYLEGYQKEFGLQPIFKTEAKTIKRQSEYWITETNNGIFKSKYVVIATGPFCKPRLIQFEGIETFPGDLIHSQVYKSGQDFKDKRVLVVGFGNSACEIAIDLSEHGANAFMSVRSPVNIIPRDLMGIPILEVSMFLSRLPPRLGDTLSAPIMKLTFGNIEKWGLKKKPYGAFEQIRREETVPVLDIGVISYIRQGHIRVLGGIKKIAGRSVVFENGHQEEFDAIIAAIGYDRNYADILEVDKSRFDDLKLPTSQQNFFGKDGLYFCGFWISPRGQIREISLDAKRIAKDISLREKAADKF